MPAPSKHYHIRYLRPVKCVQTCNCTYFHYLLRERLHQHETSAKLRTRRRLLALARQVSASSSAPPSQPYLPVSRASEFWQQQRRRRPCLLRRRTTTACMLRPLLRTRLCSRHLERLFLPVPKWKRLHQQQLQQQQRGLRLARATISPGGALAAGGRVLVRNCNR